MPATRAAHPDGHLQSGPPGGAWWAGGDGHPPARCVVPTALEGVVR